MLSRIRSHRAVALLCLALFSIAAFAQDAEKPFEPRTGLPGKDVIWWPTELVLINKMLALAKVGPGDVVADLGSGDGRTVIAAARRGARGIGVELNPDLVKLSRSNAQKEGVADHTRFLVQDLFEFDLSQANVITLFLLQSINMRLRPRILDLKPGTQVISNTFHMDDWQYDEMVRDESKIANCVLNCVAYLYVVPAKVAGTWQLPGGEIRLEQRFQMLSGTMSANGNTMAVAGRMRGDQITLTADGVEFTGRVVGPHMGGTLKINGEQHGWRATRIGN